MYGQCELVGDTGNLFPPWGCTQGTYCEYDYEEYDYFSHKDQCLNWCLDKRRSDDSAEGCIFMASKCVFLKTGTIVGADGHSAITCWKFH